MITDVPTQSPEEVVNAFVHAVLDRRFDDATACLGLGLRRVGDLEGLAPRFEEVEFIASRRWTCWRQAGDQMIDATTIELWVCDARIPMLAGVPREGWRFRLSYGEEIGYRIVRIGGDAPPDH